jgi:hypothetical protein
LYIGRPDYGDEIDTDEINIEWHINQAFVDRLFPGGITKSREYENLKILNWILNPQQAAIDSPELAPSLQDDSGNLCEICFLTHSHSRVETHNWQTDYYHLMFTWPQSAVR